MGPHRGKCGWSVGLMCLAWATAACGTGAVQAQADAALSSVSDALHDSDLPELPAAPTADVAASADAPATVVAVVDGYLPGGLLAWELPVPTTWTHPLDGPPAGSAQLTTAVAGWRQADTQLPEGAAVWSTLWQPPPTPGQRRLLQLDGALHVSAAGPVHVAVAHVGSVQVTVAGQMVLERRGEVDLVVSELHFAAAAAGWLPLQVRYVGQGLRQHLQLWTATPPVSPSSSLAWQGPAAAQLGTAPQPPLKLQLQHQLGTPNYTDVALQVDAAVPVSIGVKRADQWLVTPQPPNARTHHQLQVPLPAGDAQPCTLVAEDPWQRKLELPLGTLAAKPTPKYEPGGLRAALHKGTKLAELVSTRLEPVVLYPNEADAFGAWLGYDQFSVRWSGGLWVADGGTYTLHFGSDDGQRLWLDGKLVADLWVDHGMDWVAYTATLTPGWHPLTLEMYENGGNAAAVFEWTPPGKPRTTVPSSALGHEPLVSAQGAPALVAAEVLWLNGALRLRVRGNGLGTLLVQRKPSDGPMATETWATPADSWDKPLSGWGKAAGEVAVTFANLAGVAAPPQTLSVQPAP